MDTSPTFKVLIIRFSSIGDIVLTTPVVRALRNMQDRKVEIHYLTKKAYAGLLRNNPYVDRVWALEGSLNDLLPELRQQAFDFVLDLHNNIRSHRVKHSLRKPSSSFNKLNFRKWLLTTLKIDRMPDIHIVDRYLAAARKLGLKNDGQGLDYFIPPADAIDPENLPEPFREAFIGFVIGGQHATKKMPEEKIISLCRQMPLPVILLGGPEDQAAGERIATAVGSGLMNACGVYNLNGSASLVRQAKAVVTHDTGLMHIAAAFRKPVASVWGNTVPQLGMYPYMPREIARDRFAIFEVKGLSCRPCSKIGYKKCPKGHFRCMQDMDEQAIITWIKRMINMPEKG